MNAYANLSKHVMIFYRGYLLFFRYFSVQLTFTLDMYPVNIQSTEHFVVKQWIKQSSLLAEKVC